MRTINCLTRRLNSRELYCFSRITSLLLSSALCAMGRRVVFGFGETFDGSGKAPDRRTMLRIGSLTKAFTGQVLASLVARWYGQVLRSLAGSHRLERNDPEPRGRQIRLIDFVIHSAGLPREVSREPGRPDNPFSTLTPEAYRNALASGPIDLPAGYRWTLFQFRIGRAFACSITCRRQAVRGVAKGTVLDPTGLTDTVLSLRPDDHLRLLQGHDFDGKPLPNVTTPLIAARCKPKFIRHLTTFCAGCGSAPRSYQVQ